jgi:hypothetical protein
MILKSGYIYHMCENLCPNSIGGAVVFLTVMLGQLDIHIQKGEYEPKARLTCKKKIYSE